MVISKVLSLVNSAQEIVILGGVNGSAQITVNFGTAPSAGAVSIATKAPGAKIWKPLQKAVAVSITSGLLVVRADGPVERVRVTFAGLVGGADPVAWIAQDETPDGLFDGLAAMCTDTYVGFNVKNGLQFYIQHALPQLPATTGTYKLLFTTGAKKVLIKAREMYGNGERFQIQVFKQPSAVTGGTPVVVQNFNDIAPAETTVSVLGGVTAGNNGVAWGDPQRIFSQSAAGQRSGSGLAPGGDRILKANSTYLVVFSNTGSGTADIDYFLSWYEGDTDVPL
jgi:hypothetical protein